MALTRSQVQAAFKAARKHFKGKIPKGTKLARFVPGHHSSGTTRTRRSSTPSHHSGGGTVKSQGMASKATSAAALLIAFSPDIANAKDHLPSGNVDGWAARNLELYTGFDTSGNFNVLRLAQGYGPKVAAFAFKKVSSKLLKTCRLKI